MSGGCLCESLKTLFCKRKRRKFQVGTLRTVRRSRLKAYTKVLNGESRSKMAYDDKERPLPSSLPTPSNEDTTVEKLGNVMARLTLLEEVQEKNKALVKELQEIREERKSEGVLEKPSVFSDDPFAPIEPMHKRSSRKAKHGHGTRTFSRSLGGDFQEEEYYAPRRAYKANT
jgi:hypothetical protein